MIVWKHRSNIARLRAGTEHRFDPSNKSEPNGPAAATPDSHTVGV